MVSRTWLSGGTLLKSRMASPGGQGLLVRSDLHRAVAARGAHELLDTAAGLALDLVRYRHGGEHARQVRFDRVASAVTDRAGLWVSRPGAWCRGCSRSVSRAARRTGVRLSTHWALHDVCRWDRSAPRASPVYKLTESAAWRSSHPSMGRLLRCPFLVQDTYGLYWRTYRMYEWKDGLG